MSTLPVYAFPSPDVYHPNGQIEYGAPGMLLRDYFAAHALNGIIANTMTALAKEGITPKRFKEMVVESAFEIADAMMERRGK
jgi:hypothetical protein